MVTIKKIKVLIVEDSLLYREFLTKTFTSDPNIEVIATAADPFDAKEKLLKYNPDVMTLDVEMPRMNGIEFLRQLMPRDPLPVVVISSASERVFDALHAGAVDFVVKPDEHAGRNIEHFKNELIIKIKIASIANLSHWKKVEGRQEPDASTRLIAIGASTGGTEAISSILETLDVDVPGIVIVQHMPPVFTNMYAQRLNNHLALTIKEAKTGDVVRRGCVLIAPGDFHMTVKKSGADYKVECFKGEKVNGHCPSVDVLFQSVAQEAGKNAIGVILTGMGQDGAQGLLSMRNKGARTVGQDGSSSIVYGMPKVAYDIGAVEIQAPLGRITQTIQSLLRAK